jgi:hypothetical protein
MCSIGHIHGHTCGSSVCHDTAQTPLKKGTWAKRGTPGERPGRFRGVPEFPESCNGRHRLWECAGLARESGHSYGHYRELSNWLSPLFTWAHLSMPEGWLSAPLRETMQSANPLAPGRAYMCKGESQFDNAREPPEGGRNLPDQSGELRTQPGSPRVARTRNALRCSTNYHTI